MPNNIQIYSRPFGQHTLAMVTKCGQVSSQGLVGVDSEQRSSRQARKPPPTKRANKKEIKGAYRIKTRAKKVKTFTAKQQTHNTKK